MQSRSKLRCSHTDMTSTFSLNQDRIGLRPFKQMAKKIKKFKSQNQMKQNKPHKATMVKIKLIKGLAKPV